MWDLAAPYTMGMLLVYFAFANIFSLVLASLFLRGAPAFDSIPPTRNFGLQAAALSEYRWLKMSYEETFKP